MKAQNGATLGNWCSHCMRGAVVGMYGVCQWSDSHHFDDELDLDLDLDPDQSEKSDPDPHQGDADPQHCCRTV